MNQNYRLILPQTTFLVALVKTLLVNSFLSDFRNFLSICNSRIKMSLINYETLAFSIETFGEKFIFVWLNSKCQILVFDSLAC